MYEKFYYTEIYPGIRERVKSILGLLLCSIVTDPRLSSRYLWFSQTPW